MNDEIYYEYTFEDELISQQIREEERKEQADLEYLYLNSLEEDYITVIVRYRKRRNKPRKKSRYFYGEKRLEIRNQESDRLWKTWYRVDLIDENREKFNAKYSDDDVKKMTIYEVFVITRKILRESEQIENNTEINPTQKPFGWSDIDPLPEFYEGKMHKIINKLWEEWWDDKELNGETKEKNDIYIKKMIVYLCGLTTKYTFKFYKDLLLLPIEKNKINIADNYYLKYYSNEFWDFNEVYSVFYKLWKKFSPDLVNGNYINFAWLLNKFVKSQFMNCLQKAKKGRFTYKSKSNPDKKFIPIELVSLDDERINNNQTYFNKIDSNKINSDLNLFIKDFYNKYLIKEIDKLMFQYMILQYSDQQIQTFLKKYKISLNAIGIRKTRIRKLFNQYLEGEL